MLNTLQKAVLRRIIAFLGMPFVQRLMALVVSTLFTLCLSYAALLPTLARAVHPVAFSSTLPLAVQATIPFTVWMNSCAEA